MPALTTYQSLLVDYTPRPVRTVTAYKKVLRHLEKLMTPNPDRARSDLIELLSTMVEQYEQQSHATPHVAPADMLRHLIEERGITNAQLARDTGIPRSTITDVLAGRRQISKANAVRFGGYFGTPADLFLASVE